MFVMAATDTEHPPAAGTALGVVAHRFDWGLVLFVTVAVLILAAVHRALRSKMLDLR
jgi:CBS domain-containing membrane protein